jgi:hypothetical protein
LKEEPPGRSLGLRHKARQPVKNRGLNMTTQKPNLSVKPVGQLIRVFTTPAMSFNKA